MKIWFNKIKYILFLIFILIAIFLIVFFSKNNRWKTKKVYEQSLVQDSIAREIPWEEKTICQQFYSLEYNHNVYNARNIEIDDDRIEKELGMVTLTASDSINDIFYKKEANMYSIKEYNSNAIVAIKFEEDNNYYIYTNFYYIAETLEQLVNDLNLKESISFNSVLYYPKTSAEMETIEFPNVDEDIIWKMLLDDTSLKNVQNNTNSFEKIMSIHFNIEKLGYENINFSLTNDGYLITNILDRRNVFYIGEKKIEKFLDYVIKNCEGYRLEYIYDNIEEVEENYKIMKFDKATNQTTIVDIPNSSKDVTSNGYDPNSR